MASMRALVIACLFVITACATLQCRAQEIAGGCGANEAQLKLLAPEGAVDFACILVPRQGGRYLVSWTTRDSQSSPSSHLRLVELRADTNVVLYKRRISHGYATSFQYTSRFAKDKSPILVVTTQYGAAQQDVGIVSIRPEGLRIHWQAGGDYLEFNPVGGGDDLVISHSFDGGIDAPELLQLRGEHFVDVSRLHPDYYRDLLAQNKPAADGSAISPSLYPQLARLLSLSGNDSASKKVLASRKNDK